MTQGSRPRTQNNLMPRADLLEAKDRNARGQGKGPRTQRVDSSVFQKKVFLNLPRGVWRVLQNDEKKRS